MAIEYRITYKCRLCGDVFESGKTRNRELMIDEMAKIASESPLYSNCHKYFPHHCNDTDIGMADFIGVKGYEV